MAGAVRGEPAGDRAGWGVSSIRFHDIRTGESVPISGSERAWLGNQLERVLGLTVRERVSGGLAQRLNQILADHPVLRLSARIHGQCELGGWVAREDREWFARLIRTACETSIRVKPFPDERNAPATEWFEDVFRVAMSTYGGEGGWWRLHDWLRQPGGDVVMSYSVSGWPWSGEDDDEATMRPTDPRLPGFLREHHAQCRLQPADWETYRFGE